MSFSKKASMEGSTVPEPLAGKSEEEIIDSEKLRQSSKQETQKNEEEIFETMRSVLRDIMGDNGQDRTVLAVMNEFDGMGDEIIRMHLLQRLLTQYPKAEILIYTKYPFLYQQSAHVSVLPRNSFVAIQPLDFDVVLDHRAHLLKEESTRTHLEFLKAEGFYVKTAGDGQRHHSVSEVRSRTQTFVDRGRVAGREFFLEEDSVYAPIVRLADILGLPEHPDTTLFLGKDDAAQPRIEQQLRSAEASEYALVNPFGNPNAKTVKEGYGDTKLLYKDILALHEQYPCVMICAFSPEDHQKAAAALETLPTPLQKKTLIIDFFLPDEVDPKFYVANASRLVTCEGGLMHLAYALQCPVTVVSASGGGGNEWLPPGLPESDVVTMGDVDSSL